MKTTARILPVLALAATASIAWIAAGAAASVRPQAAPSLTTPEHKLFEKYAGTWDAECTMNTPDG
jgi:ABC-type Na+ efflux pump permease subunit